MKRAITLRGKKNIHTSQQLLKGENLNLDLKDSTLNLILSFEYSPKNFPKITKQYKRKARSSAYTDNSHLKDSTLNLILSFEYSPKNFPKITKQYKRKARSSAYTDNSHAQLNSYEAISLCTIKISIFSPILYNCKNFEVA